MVDRGQTPGEQRKAEEQNGIEKRVSKINRAREGNTTRKMVPPPKRAVIDEDLDPDAMDIDVEPMPTFPSPFPGPPGEPVHRDFNEVRDYIQANYCVYNYVHYLRPKTFIITHPSFSLEPPSVTKANYPFTNRELGDRYNEFHNVRASFPGPYTAEG